MRKYKNYYYKVIKYDGLFWWIIYSAYIGCEVLQLDEKGSVTKGDAQADCEEHIDEYYY